MAKGTEEPAALVLLKVLAGDGTAVRRFHLAAGRYVVGSQADAEVHLDEPGVSRRHARLDVLRDGGVVVADLGSKNGTFAGGRKVQEAAVCGFGVLAFGSIQAVLQPVDPVRGQVLLGPPAGLQETPETPAGSPALPPAPGPGTSTQGLHPLERLVESLGEILPALADGLVTPQDAAAELAQRWIEVLPVGRVEFLRAGVGREAPAILAAASTANRLPPAGGTGLEVDGPDGWRVHLRAAPGASLSSLAPLLRLVLSLLAAGPGGRAGWRRRGEEAAKPRPADPGQAEPVPPPPGLGVEMAKIYHQAGRVAQGDVPVLILGESGVGKEVLARWVHARSRRAAGPFLAVNCAALPRELLEAELFGIEKGVATGVEARPGILERAGGGTVFLDEIGDMAPETQAKVLRVLENTSLFRVGGRNPVQVDVRFLAATNRELEALVDEGGFRRDLYHRLAAFEVRIPPLRQRREEIPSLAARFFHRDLAKGGRSSPGITRGALGALVQYPWPGNVRELQNEIAKATLLLEAGEPLDLPHLSERVRRSPGQAGSGSAGSASAPAPLTLEQTVQRAEREAFAVALAAVSGDAARAMELLGVSKTTFYRKIKELGMAEIGEPG